TDIWLAPRTTPARSPGLAIAPRPHLPRRAGTLPGLASTGRERQTCPPAHRLSATSQTTQVSRGPVQGRPRVHAARDRPGPAAALGAVRGDWPGGRLEAAGGDSSRPDIGNLWVTVAWGLPKAGGER